jgi:cell division protein FtsQ
VSPSEIAQHRPPPPAPRDPAPSRLTYKANRLWLTPGFRTMMRVGLPVLLAISALGWYVSDADNRAAIAAQVAETRRSIETRPEFMLKLMVIEGASPVLADTARALMPVDFPVSSFDLDLEAMQARVAALDVVKSVDILIRPGGVLEVNVTERDPVLVWRRTGALELVDATGHRVATLVERSARADLPLIAGWRANARVDEALAILAVAEPANLRVRGLVRIGERRWDVVLDDGPTILLPETEPMLALQQVLALDEAQDLLARHVTHVDMRDPRRPTLRLGPTPAPDLTPTQSDFEE